ncbi:hypothetical protein K438DRAFT_1994318 [Mycena galopus ATCC 62051]|nr:hypothetical protein K438DRAFT_1994318 [Mycena galopus ATCC 62051]
MAPTALREMDWATYRYTWTRFQWGRLYADGSKIHTPVWAKVPVAHGIHVARKATKMESEVWIDADRGGYEGSINGALTSVRVDVLGPVQLEHSFTVVVAKQTVDGLLFYPQNRWVNKHLPDLPNSWRGNILVLKHGKTAEKRIIHMRPEDFALVDLIVKHSSRCLIVGQIANKTRAARRLRATVAQPVPNVVNPASETFFRTDELRRLALSYLPLLALFTYARASQFTRGDVMGIACERIMHYVKPFFGPTNHVPIGSVALAVLSFGADIDIPSNLNLVSSAATEESWVAVMCGTMGFTLQSSGACKGYYATLGKSLLVFKHVDVLGKAVSVTITKGENFIEFFLHARSTLKTNAVTAHELVLDTGPYPRSPFPQDIVLHDFSKSFAHACGSACPAMPRWSTNAAGIGHWAWAGVGNLEWEEDPVLQIMTTSDVKYLLAFLRDPSTPALATDIYNVDFNDGVYGSYALDETACTDDVGAPYYKFIIGQVSMVPTFEDANWRFRISSSGGAEEELGATFARQVIQLAAMVKEADEEDFDLDRKVAVENFTDADRYSLLGGTWIEFMMSLPPVYIERDGELVRTQPTAARDYPMHMGDWVLVRAGLHRWDDRSGYNIRVSSGLDALDLAIDYVQCFSIVPESIRVLDFPDPAGGETTEEDTLSDGSVGGNGQVTEEERLPQLEGSLTSRGVALSNALTAPLALQQVDPQSARLPLSNTHGKFRWGTPPETTEAILLEACGTYLDSRLNYVEGSGQRKQFLAMRLTICLVCRSWRDIVYTGGAFWLSYVLRPFKEHQPMLLWMSRMKRFPLHLHLLESVDPTEAVDPVDVEEIIELLLSKLEQCQTLSLLNEDNTMAMWVYLGLARGVFPAMTRLVLQSTGSTAAWDCTFEGCLDAPKPSGAVTLTDMVTALKDTPLLERLCLSKVESYGNIGPNVRVPLPNLRVFHVELQRNHWVAQLIAMMVTPALHDLSLVVDNEEDLGWLAQCANVLAGPTTLYIQAHHVEPAQLGALYGVIENTTCLDLSGSDRECWASIDRGTTITTLFEDATASHARVKSRGPLSISELYPSFTSTPTCPAGCPVPTHSIDRHAKIISGGKTSPQIIRAFIVHASSPSSPSVCVPTHDPYAIGLRAGYRSSLTCEFEGLGARRRRRRCAQQNLSHSLAISQAPPTDATTLARSRKAQSAPSPQSPCARIAAAKPRRTAVATPFLAVTDFAWT